MRSRLFLLPVLLVFAEGVLAQSISDRLDGPESAYTGRLVRLLKLWPAARIVSEPLRNVELTCISTPDEEAYVGILRRATVLAPLAAVEDVLDDVSHYKDLFPGTVDVRLLPGSRHGGRFATAWEQRVPVFFLPHVFYELSHLVDKSSPGIALYRYKLRRSGQLISSDGIVVLESVGPRTTQFTEYGFFLPRSGPVPASVLWRESVRGAFLANTAIKLRAENPDWTYARIASEGERLLASESVGIERCLAHRHYATLDEGINAPPAMAR